MNDWGFTNKVPAEVVLAEGIVLRGDLHLLARPSYPPGPETPLEMLCRADPFFALTLAVGGVAGPLLEQTGVPLGSARAGLGEAADYLEPIKLNERQAGIEIRG